MSTTAFSLVAATHPLVLTFSTNLYTRPRQPIAFQSRAVLASFISRRLTTTSASTLSGLSATRWKRSALSPRMISTYRRLASNRPPSSALRSVCGTGRNVLELLTFTVTDCSALFILPKELRLPADRAPMALIWFHTRQFVISFITTVTIHYSFSLPLQA